MNFNTKFFIFYEIMVIFFIIALYIMDLPVEIGDVYYTFISWYAWIGIVFWFLVGSPILMYFLGLWNLDNELSSSEKYSEFQEGIPSVDQIYICSKARSCFDNCKHKNPHKIDNDCLKQGCSICIPHMSENGLLSDNSKVSCPWKENTKGDENA